MQKLVQEQQGLAQYQSSGFVWSGWHGSCTTQHKVKEGTDPAQSTPGRRCVRKHTEHTTPTATPFHMKSCVTQHVQLFVFPYRPNACVWGAQKLAVHLYGLAF